MARPIDREFFADDEYDRFGERLRRNLQALHVVLDRPGFGAGPTTLGAELELSLIDRNGRACPVNRALVAAQRDPRLCLEIDRFNLEYNLTPVAAVGSPFAALEAEMTGALATVRDAAAPLDARPVAIGILPTLAIDDLQSGALTDLPRYRALSHAMRRLRGACFELRIAGEESLAVTSDDIAVEGANTSFQVHLRVEPADFTATYNAAQLATPIALALCANSPTFLGRRLWDETRVALFKQSLDERTFDASHWHPPSRVSFGHGWVRSGAGELFDEAVALYPPLFPVTAEDEDPVAIARAGCTPGLDELRLHQGTVWRWNRAIYDPDEGGHLRIEMRALPAGPTPLDMVAGAAFLVGLTMGLRDDVDRLVNVLPFRIAEYDFYRAAQHGLDARLVWPWLDARERSGGLVERPVSALARALLPTAERGLAMLGVDSCEAARLLDVVRARLDSSITPARWQRRVLDRLGHAMTRADALTRMLDAYVRCAGSGRPVHEWSEVS